MLSYKILRLVNMIMVFSIGCLFAEILLKRFGNDNDKRFLRYARVILSFVNVGVFIWLFFNKEVFHWNYDIATGEPVDHYSTYGKCVLCTAVAIISNVAAFSIDARRKH